MSKDEVMAYLEKKEEELQTRVKELEYRIKILEAEKEMMFRVAIQMIMQDREQMMRERLSLNK